MATRREVLEEVKLWEAFVENKCFKQFQSTIQEQIDGRVQQVMMTPLENSGEAVKQEFVKGEYTALKLVIDLPNLQIEALRMTLETLKEENGNE